MTAHHHTALKPPAHICGQPAGLSALIERKLFILNARKGGHRRAKIAAALGIAAGTVSRIASSPVTAPGHWTPCIKGGVEYASQADASRAHGVSASSVSWHLSRHGNLDQMGARA